MNRILIDASVHQTRIAVVENGRLAELYWESKRQESLVGNIYVGRIENVIKGMQAAFVDIGQSKNAYLYYGKERAVTDKNPKESRKLKQGDTVLVQVTKDASGTKGAVVTEKISFPGKFLVLLAEDGKDIGISKKITENEERIRLRNIADELLPDHCSLIVRTNGVGKSKDEFEQELFGLVQKYEYVQKGIYMKPPALLLQEVSPSLKIARELYVNHIKELVVNDSEIYESLLKVDGFAEENGLKLIYHKENVPLFEAYFVERQAEKALDKKVWLKSGGFIVIEQTEACVVIDVNTGKYTGKKNLQKTILKTNLEAAEEIAVQLRLRNLSGIVIADFIDMVLEEDKQLVQSTLENAVKKDRTKTVVVGMTPLGLMQITRKKTRPSLQQQMTVKCQCCGGTGRYPCLEWIVGEVRRKIESIFANTIYNKVVLTGNDKLIEAFCGKKDKFLHEMQDKHQKKIECIPSKRISLEHYSIESIKE